MRIELPSATVEKALSALMVPTLKPMMGLLSIPKPRPTRKAGMVESILLRLTGRDRKAHV